MTTMVGSLTKRLMAIAISATVALTLVPLPAHADSYKTASVGKTSSMQANKRVSVYVVTKVVEPDSSTKDTEYTYGKDGLLLKRTRHSKLKSKADDVMDYQYKGSRLVLAMRKRVSDQWSNDEKVTYAYDKKGNLTKSIRTVVSTELTGEDAGDVGTYKIIKKAAYDKKGRMKTYKTKSESDGDDKRPYSVSRNKSYNKQGRPTKTMTHGSGSVVEYYYDKHGNFTHASDAHPTEKFKLKYDKKGNLVQRSVYDTDFKETSDVVKYTYKKISVPKSYAKVVRAQQYDIVNPRVDPMLSFD